MRVVLRPFGRFLLLATLLGGVGLLAPDRSPAEAAAPPDPGAAVVKVYVSAIEPLVFTPWRPGYSTSRTGSGAVVEGGRILTNAHVVQGHTFVQVRPNGSPEKYPAEVAFVSHVADLALLEVKDPAFHRKVTPLPLGELPAIQDSVAAYGFPNGGETLSITAGVVSRVEHESYVHGRDSLLSIQMDAAIAPGSSGGPLVGRGRLVGIAMQAWGESAIGCAIPEPVVRQFLEDVADGRHDGIPKLGVGTQTLENPALKASLGVPAGETGVLVNVVTPDSPLREALQVDDILLALNGVDVADDGTVEFRPRERTSLRYVSDRQQVGDTVTVRLARGGELREAHVALTRARGQGELMPRLHDRSADYYVFGGLAFVALSMDHVDSMRNYRVLSPDVAEQLSRYPQGAGDEVVYLADVLSGDVNRGYEDARGVVVRSVDGEPVRSLAGLVRLVEGGTGPFVTFGHGSGRRITLARAEAQRANPELLARYGLNADRSMTGSGDDPRTAEATAAPPPTPELRPASSHAPTTTTRPATR